MGSVIAEAGVDISDVTPCELLKRTESLEWRHSETPLTPVLLTLHGDFWGPRVLLCGGFLPSYKYIKNYVLQIHQHKYIFV